jgi:quercetin 2,3-dioxygenase
VSGPVTTSDAPVEGDPDPVAAPELEITESREAQVGAFRVRRALPHRPRRTVGAWCFVDHMGPAEVTREHGIDIGPHPHIGLQTVTWLLAGEVLHRDSLGSEQVIRPGQLNLMTAGHGVSHAEEATGRYDGPLHGVQLWVAQPAATRDGAPAFEHHAELPRIELGPSTATVLVGEVAGTASPARRDTEHVGLDLELRPGSTDVPLDHSFEHALVVFDGAVTVDGTAVVPGRLAYLGAGRDQIALGATEAGRALLIGGAPFEERILMWWNFVARTREEVSAARDDWMAGHVRFGVVASPLDRIDVGEPPWTT